MMKLGDFTGLAEAYADSRPGYATQIPELLISLANVQPDGVVVDVGAGTGIWTRMLREATSAFIYAVEPNLDMVRMGKQDSHGEEITWVNSPAETFDLDRKDVDLITMASSFHWVNFEIAINNFKNHLKSGGIFCALWNTRQYESHPKLLEIESHLKTLSESPRVSSGRSEFTSRLLDRFETVFGQHRSMLIEARHKESMTRDRYCRIWESVNDVQFHLGKEKFADFLEFAKSKFDVDEAIEVTYLTRAWIGVNS